MMRKVAKFVVLFVSALLAGCAVEIPEHVIEPDKMENVLYDYHLAQVLTSEMSSASYEKKLHASYVFKKHGITKEQFDSSLVWYTRYPKQMVRIYSNLEKRITAEIEATSDGYNVIAGMVASEEMMADTVDLWNKRSVSLLSSSALTNRVEFNYKADTTFVRGDSLVFSFTARFLPDADSVVQGAHVALVVQYGDKSSRSNGMPLKGDGAYCIDVQRDFKRNIEAVHGFVYYSDNDSLHLSKLLLGDIAVRRIHPLKEEE